MAGIDLVPEFDSQGRMARAWVVDVNPRPAGLRHGRAVKTCCWLVWQGSFHEQSVAEMLLQLVRERESTMDESHLQLLQERQQ